MPINKVFLTVGARARQQHAAILCGDVHHAMRMTKAKEQYGGRVDAAPVEAARLCVWG